MNNPVIHNFFCPTKEQVKLFRLLMNGRWWSYTRLWRTVGKALYDEEYSRQVLSEAVENAFLELGFAMIDFEGSANLRATDGTEPHYEFPLGRYAIRRCIRYHLPFPQNNKESDSLASDILLTLNEHLTDGGALLTDSGGRITLKQGRFTMRMPLKNIKMPESECSLQHSERPYTGQT